MKITVMDSHDTINKNKFRYLI